MAENFRIMCHRTGESLHLKLMGDFDGSAAHELLNILKENARRTSRIFVHTAGLNQIYPFGGKIVQSDRELSRTRPLSLIFTGEKADQIAPRGAYQYDHLQRRKEMVI